MVCSASEDPSPDPRPEPPPTAPDSRCCRCVSLCVVVCRCVSLCVVVCRCVSLCVVVCRCCHPNNFGSVVLLLRFHSTPHLTTHTSPSHHPLIPSSPQCTPPFTTMHTTPHHNAHHPSPQCTPPLTTMHKTNNTRALLPFDSSVIVTYNCSKQQETKRKLQEGCHH